MKPCPVCEKGVPESDVQMTDSFLCRHCHSEICVNKQYRTALAFWTGMVGTVLPFSFGADLVDAITAIPVTVVACTWLGEMLTKHIFRPHLQRFDTGEVTVLGL